MWTTKMSAGRQSSARPGDCHDPSLDDADRSVDPLGPGLGAQPPAAVQMEGTQILPGFNGW